MMMNLATQVIGIPPNRVKYLLYPVIPSPMDYFELESKGHLVWVMRSRRLQVFGGRLGRQ
jgi:hypothetical protein